MARPRRLIGLATLKEARRLLDEGVPVTIIYSRLELDKQMHYRSVNTLLKADAAGFTNATRPEWLLDEPVIQTAPDGWKQDGEFPMTQWSYYGDNN